MNKALSAIIGCILTIILTATPETREFIYELMGNYTIIGLFLPTILGFSFWWFLKDEEKEKQEIFIEYFTVKIGDKEVYKKALVDEKIYYLGKSNDCELRLNLPFIDDKHLYVKNMKTFVSVCSISDKAVHLNRQRLKKNQFVEVKKNDCIQIGKIKILFI
jgi:hypothetical protein